MKERKRPRKQMWMNEKKMSTLINIKFNIFVLFNSGSFGMNKSSVDWVPVVSVRVEINVSAKWNNSWLWDHYFELALFHDQKIEILTEKMGP